MTTQLKPLEPTTIRRLLRGVELERAKLVKLHEKRMKALLVKEQGLQARCPHNWEYLQDAMREECVICHKVRQY